jgi:hypothetical protein
MKITNLVLAAMLSIFNGFAIAAPIELTEAEMAKTIAGAQPTGYLGVGLESAYYASNPKSITIYDPSGAPYATAQIGYIAPDDVSSRGASTVYSGWGKSTAPGY